MTPRNELWARGYATQAKAEFDAYQAMGRLKDFPACIDLHFLQMACEKLCKAHQCGKGTNPDRLQSSHAAIAGVQPVIAKQQFAQRGGKAIRDHSTRLRQIRQLAREIELLAPSVMDGGRRPENCEYPWENGGRLYVPAEYDFPNLNLLSGQAGRLLLKIISAAIDDLLAS